MKNGVISLPKDKNITALYLPNFNIQNLLVFTTKVYKANFINRLKSNKLKIIFNDHLLYLSNCYQTFMLELLLAAMKSVLPV